MRVLHCYSGNLYGGIEAVLATLARCRDLEPGLEPHVALCFEGRLADELRAAGVPVDVIGPVRMSRPWTVLAMRRRLRAVLARVQPEVVVCHAPWSHALMAPTARQARRPVVYWQHDAAGDRSWPERMASRTRPDLVISNSRHSASTLPWLFPGTPVEVLYNPVSAPEVAADPAAERAAIRRELNTPDDAPVVIQVSRMEAWKGHTLLLEALGQLREHPGWVAWIVGGAQRPHEQAYLEALRAQAAAAGIAERVRFLGQRSDARRLMAAADVHCQPNTGPEPFGITFIEALYAGLPVVSTRMGGAAEIVTEACGVLVEPGDAAGLAAALGGLFADPSARERLGAAGPARAAELCDPARMLRQLHAHLGPLVNPSSPTTLELSRS